MLIFSCVILSFIFLTVPFFFPSFFRMISFFLCSAFFSHSVLCLPVHFYSFYFSYHKIWTQSLFRIFVWIGKSKWLNRKTFCHTFSLSLTVYWTEKTFARRYHTSLCVYALFFFFCSFFLGIFVFWKIHKNNGAFIFITLTFFLFFRWVFFYIVRLFYSSLTHFFQLFGLFVFL